jgi:hypothetical protein
LLNIHKRTKTLKFFKKHIVGIHMGSKATITNFKFYFCLPHTQYAAKN